MNDILRAMRERALIDPSFRRAVLATAESADPLAALCDVAQQNGFDLTLADIISDGEEFSCNQTKSTNGGNPMPYDCFDDSYDMFILSLKYSVCSNRREAKKGCREQGSLLGNRNRAPAVRDSAR